ncbi:hypothetical protein [Streptococcus intermedius]|uniref:hypothetical protein n=1 Tax=Streptococcus intermedius TaxID=1338 RepID=UPI000C81F6F9|nr:hypothetical protein [Streptococcus intermedius]PMR63622.1 hypothetical protein C1I61_08190 [Streptococcus intermedius]WOI91761.1 hypothetical protein RYQ61_02690 [Streptococcus intermedius]
MKKIYWVVVFTFLATLFFYLSQLIKETYHFSIPHAKASIQVVDWDKVKSSATIYKKLEKFSREQNLEIYKVTFGTSPKGHSQKNVYYFPSNRAYRYDTSRLKDKVIFKKSSSLTIENPLGTYYLKKEIPEKFIQLLKELGLKVEIERNMLRLILTQFFSNELGFLLFFLSFIIFLIDLFVSLSLSKKIGILELHGRNIFSLLFGASKIEALLLFMYFLFSAIYFPLGLPFFMTAALLVFFLLQLSHLVSIFVAKGLSSITEKIKEKKPYKKLLVFNVLIKVFVLSVCAVTLFQGFKDVKTLRTTEKTLAIWQKIPNYAQLTFSENTTLISGKYSNQAESEERDQKSRKAIADILSLGEATGGLFAEYKKINMLKSEYKTPPFSNYMVVNHQFLKEVPIYTPKGDRIGQLTKHKFYVIVPENLISKQKQIVQVMREIITFHQNVKTDYKKLYEGEIEVLVSKANQQIFNFNTSDLTKTTIYNPVILVGAIELFGKNSDVLVAEVSQGRYLFKDTVPIAKYIKTHRLEKDFAGLISSREEALRKLNMIQSQLYLKLVGVVASGVIFAIINYFLIMTYLEVERKKIIIWYLFGKSFLERHAQFLLSMLAISFVTLMIVFWLNMTVFSIISGILFIDTAMYALLLLFFEKRERLTTLKKGD